MTRRSPGDGRPRRFLIITSGMSLNKGDQAILESSQELYSRFVPDGCLTFVSTYSGFLATIRSALTVLRNDTILLNVGHPIQDKTSWLYVPSVFWRLFLGIMAGKDVGMIAGGASVLKSHMLSRWVTWILNHSVIVSVRDKESAERLHRWGVTKPVITAADPGLLVHPTGTERAEAFLHSLPAKPIVGLAPRRWFHYEHSFLPVRRPLKGANSPPRFLQYQEALVSSANHVVKQLGGIVVLIAMKPGSSAMPGQDDDVFASELLSRVDHPESVFVMPRDFSPGEMKHCVRSFELLIGVRMHSTILALAVTTPCINVYYNEKGLSLFKALKMGEYALPIEECTSQAMVRLIDTAWPRRKAIRKQIGAELPALESRVILPYKWLAQYYG